MKISVVGTGYVGLSLAVLISRKHNVTAVDVIPEKVDQINNRISPIVDSDIQHYLSEEKLNLKATLDINETKSSDFVIIATPTNYDPETHYFNTSSVEGVISQINQISPESTIVIKSTIPIGFTSSLNYNNVIFSPEFLREGRALYDNLHPSRIIAGIPSENLRDKAQQFVELLADCSLEENIPTIVMGSTEAESVKLFSNTYLAMRVSFFNELDTFAEKNNLSSEQIIKGVCLDPRIRGEYNNPSFGYGGYCLPKDTKQLLSNYAAIPNSLMKAIVESNVIRKRFIADSVEEKAGKENAVIGVFRLTMKTGSDNFRESSVFDIMDMLREDRYEVIVYEPTVKEDSYKGFKVIHDFNEFTEKCDVIMANRFGPELEPVKDKVFCRDIFRRD